MQGGRVVGATDRIGGKPVRKPVDAKMVGATILEAAGVSLADRVALNVLPGGEVIDELFH